jgi:hypothetical protein
MQSATRYYAPIGFPMFAVPNDYSIGMQGLENVRPGAQV